MKAVILAGLTLGLAAPVAESQQKVFDGFNSTRCVIAARVIDAQLRRDVPDTGVYRPGADTLFTLSADSIRMCQAAFGSATADPDESLDLARTQLYTRQDSAAIATARRHYGTMAKRSPGERAWELYLIASDNLSGKPARLDESDKATAELDAMGAAAASVRTLAHNSRAYAAWSRYDDATVIEATNATIKAWKELDTETQLWRAGPLASTFLLRAHLEALTKGGEAALAVIDTARGTIPKNATPQRRMIESAARMYQLLGKSAAPIQAASWFNVGEDGVERPKKGKVSLILPAQRPCTFSCPPMMRAMKRFEKQFRGRGLQMTFHLRTHGFFVDTAPATPFDEARYDSTYFVDEWKVPGALAVFETQFSWHNDGRRIDAPTANQLNYPNTAVAFVDKRGIIRYVASSWQSALEKRYADFIEQLLNEDTATPASSP